MTVGPPILTAHCIIAGECEQSKDAWLEQATLAYAADGSSLEVNFRELAPEIRTGADRHTHLIHPYPAKLLAQIPHLFLRAGQLATDGPVLDPFCGSGTVLLEAALAGRGADGADANPLARLIAAVKVSPPDPDALCIRLGLLLLSAKAMRAEAPDVVNIRHWYDEVVIERLSALRAAILNIEALEERRFFELCLSACARRMSFADPRLSVPVRLNRERLGVYGAKGVEALARLDQIEGAQVLPCFATIAEGNIERVRRYRAVAPATREPILYEDARELGGEDRRYALAITSPPYVGAQKYVRASSLSLGWLGLTPGAKLRPLERLSIGREHYERAEHAQAQVTGYAAADRALAAVREQNPLRAHIASNYLVEMDAALAETHRVTKDGGWLVLIAGQNLVCGAPFDTPAFLEEIAARRGFTTKARLVDTIRSRGLMTKRNRTAGLINQEVVLVMQKHG